MASTTVPRIYKPQLGLVVGDEAVDFKLRDPNGTEVSLFGLLNEKPVMLEFGSYT